MLIDFFLYFKRDINYSDKIINFMNFFSAVRCFLAALMEDDTAVRCFLAALMEDHTAVRRFLAAVMKDHTVVRRFLAALMKDHTAVRRFLAALMKDHTEVMLVCSTINDHLFRENYLNTDTRRPGFGSLC